MAGVGFDFSQLSVSGSNDAASQIVQEVEEDPFQRPDCDFWLNKPQDKEGNTLLHLASRDGDVSQVERLIQHNAPIRKVNKHGLRAIDEAVTHGQVTTVEAFLRADPASLTDKTSTGLSLLHLAVQAGQEAVVSSLLTLACKSLINERDGQGCTALMLAARAKDSRIIHLLVEKGADSSLADAEGKTALHHVAECSTVDIAKLFATKDVSFFALTFQKWTVLHVAAMRGDETLCAYFIERLVPINALTQDRCTALHYAILSRHRALVEVLLSSGADIQIAYLGITPVIQLLYSHLPQLIELCLSSGAQIDDTSSAGETVLQIACSKGDVDRVRFCLEKGAVSTKATHSGWTPLHSAAKMGSVDIAGLLIANGAIVAAKEGTGQTPLHVAVKARQSQMVAFLLHHIDPECQDNGGKTALHLLCQSPKPCEDMLQTLLEAKASVTSRDIDGRTPFHYMRFDVSDEVFDMLSSYARSLDVVDSKGITPVALACRDGQVPLIRRFFAAGANPQLIDQMGLKPIDRVPITNNQCMRKLFAPFKYLQEAFGDISPDVSSSYFLYGGIVAAVGVATLLGAPYILAKPLEACLPSAKTIVKDVYTDYHKIVRTHEGTLARSLPKFDHDVYQRQQQLQKLLQTLRECPECLLNDTDNRSDANPLEVAFLLGDFALMQKLKERLGTKFQDYLKLLTNAYPNLCKDLFDECVLYPFPAHLIQSTSYPLQQEILLRLQGFRREIVTQIAYSLFRSVSMVDRIKNSLVYLLIELLGSKIGIHNTENLYSRASWPFFSLDSLKERENEFLSLFWASYNSHAIITCIEEHCNALLCIPDRRALVIAGLQAQFKIKFDEMEGRDRAGISTNCVHRAYIRLYLQQIAVLEGR